MGSQRVGHDWATELNWTELKAFMITCDSTFCQGPGSSHNNLLILFLESKACLYSTKCVLLSKSNEDHQSLCFFFTSSKCRKGQSRTIVIFCFQVDIPACLQTLGPKTFFHVAVPWAFWEFISLWYRSVLLGCPEYFFCFLLARSNLFDAINTVD